ncbi:MAG: TlpA family protein disulfide reductase [Clostridia bacterium]|nr:TlpA family protein disulfide reductase [Clostridia bacterium]
MPLPPFLPLWGGVGTTSFALASLAAAGLFWIAARGALRRALRSGDAAFSRADLSRLALRGPVLLSAAWCLSRGAALLLHPDWDWSAPMTWIGLATASLSYAGAVAGLAAGWWLASFAERRLAGGPPLAADLRTSLAVADALVVPAALALAVGWLGLPGYGTLTRLPWAARLPGGLAAHPVQLYGALGYAVLAFLFRRVRLSAGPPGEAAFRFLAASSALRLFIGFFASDPLLTSEPVALSAGQWADAALLVAFGTLALAARRRAEPGPGPRGGRAVGALVAGFLLASAFLAFAGRGPQAVGVAPGFAAPDFSLTSLDGPTFRLVQARGAPLVLDFWASWCPPCRAELPLLDAFAAQGEAEGRVLAVDVAEDPETVRAFLEEEGLSLTVLLDRQGRVRELYGVRALPTTVFLDARGVVSSVVVGPLTREALARRWQEAGGSPSR